jgi:hypothetical protein
MGNFKDTPVTELDLAGFDEVFEGSDGEATDFESIPDGHYQVRVDSVQLLRSSKGDPMLKWSLRVLGPTHEDRLLWRNNVMASADNVVWLKKDLFTCGLRLAKLSELPANLERLLDICLEVTKKTKGDFESIYFNKRITTAAEAGQADAASTAGKLATRPSGKAREALNKF